MSFRARTKVRGRASRERRRLKALELQAERSKRSPQEQLARLDQEFGVGQSAERERKRLS